MEDFIVSELACSDFAVEIVERKGLGHPDTICDALAEVFSRNLTREYRARFGEIAHHNVDKALLCGGEALPSFGGGTVITPIHIYLAGRAVSEVRGLAVPVTEIAVDGSRAWLAASFHALDVNSDVQIKTLVRPGSQDLQNLFLRQGTVPLANDSSIGVGYAPLSSLERLVLAIEKRMNGRDRLQQSPAWGEDIKILAVRRGKHVQLTIACAMIGRYLTHLDEYILEKELVKNLARELAAEHGLPNCDVEVNAADEEEASSIYLTVTGTSAEAGDDGQVGRGNRINGLITPCRPMSLEAAAGKNAVTHVGKIYNVIAQQIAERILVELQDIAATQCLLVSRIGNPITDPSVVHVQLAAHDGAPVDSFAIRTKEIAASCLTRAPQLIDDFENGKVEVF